LIAPHDHVALPDDLYLSVAAGTAQPGQATMPFRPLRGGQIMACAKDRRLFDNLFEAIFPVAGPTRLP